MHTEGPGTHTHTLCKHVIVAVGKKIRSGSIFTGEGGTGRRREEDEEEECVVVTTRPPPPLQQLLLILVFLVKMSKFLFINSLYTLDTTHHLKKELVSGIFSLISIKISLKIKC